VVQFSTSPPVQFFMSPDNDQGNLLREPKTNNPIPYGTGFFVGVKDNSGTGNTGI
jgi:hypothetical protein